jgi:4-hydroxy-tetrahydrodipicolinate reductase
MRLLLVGHGRMGRLVEDLAASHGCEIAGIVLRQAGRVILDGDFGEVDAAVDFSHADQIVEVVSALAQRKINIVIGTTGWHAQEPAIRAITADANIGVFAAANFSLGMHVFKLVAADAARRFAAVGNVGAWVHEAHHSAKKDAPSGTALMLRATMKDAGYNAHIDMSSTRAGFIPGTHEVGFDGASDSVSLTHTVRDRAVFAHGAIEAAKWLKGRRGWFGMDDMIR